jgi:hypothetical protein
MQERNKCWADSTLLQPDTQKWVAGAIMPRDTQITFVGNLSLNSLHAKMDAFKGTCLCQMKSSVASKVIVCWNVKSLKLSNRERDQVATPRNQEPRLAKRNCEVESENPPTSPPPTPIIVSATLTLPHQPPILKRTSQPQYSTSSQPNQISA